MPELSQRNKTVESISKSSIHQSLSTTSSQLALARSRSSTLNDPRVAMEHLRNLLQPSINQEIQKVLQKYVDTYFTLALSNAKNCLGDDKVDAGLIDEVCANVLEGAKAIYLKKVRSSAKKRARSRKMKLNAAATFKKSPSESMEDIKDPGIVKSIRSTNTDLMLVNKNGLPVRREGPKWDPDRFGEDTFFILGSRANKALGFGQNRGRLYTKHPELFKYSTDQEDREWLAKNQLMTTTGGKTFLMVLEDVVELSKEYVDCPRQQPNELFGFPLPFFMIDKIRHFARVVKTDPNQSDEQVINRGEEQIVLWEEERKRFRNPNGIHHHGDHPGVVSQDDYMQEILNEMKKEQPTNDASGEDDLGLGFLHGMNLTNLVREFEMETATGNGAQHLGILSLADDDTAEGTFPELAEEVAEEEEGNRIDIDGNDDDHSTTDIQNTNLN